MHQPRIKLPEQVLFALVEDGAGDVCSVRRKDLEPWEVLQLLKPELRELHLSAAEEFARVSSALAPKSKPARRRSH